MKELSVFIDESGDFGEVKEHQGLSQMQKKLNRQEAAQNSLTNMFILLFSFGMLFFMLWNFKSGNVTYDKMLLATLAMMGSFGPVVALSSLSNNLTQTLASGERVLSLLGCGQRKGADIREKHKRNQYSGFEGDGILYDTGNLSVP